jgi:hypothetical protein
MLYLAKSPIEFSKGGSTAVVIGTVVGLLALVVVVVGMILILYYKYFKPRRSQLIGNVINNVK